MGGNAVCADISKGGALAGALLWPPFLAQLLLLRGSRVSNSPEPVPAVRHAPGGFENAQVLEWWVKTDGGKPALSINLGAGSVGAWRRCRCPRMAALAGL
jgi:hypothetical protein